MRPAGALLALAVAGLTLVPARPAAAAEFVVTLPGDPAPGPACLAGGDCSLREAVLAANATAGPDLVRLPAGTFALSRVGAGEDAAAAGDLDVTDDLILAGAGSADTIVDGGALGDRILDVRGTSVRLEGLTITGGGRLAGGGIVSGAGTSWWTAPPATSCSSTRPWRATRATPARPATSGSPAPPR
jgi:CSLREA domain-containing protein